MNKEAFWLINLMIVAGATILFSGERDSLMSAIWFGPVYGVRFSFPMLAVVGGVGSLLLVGNLKRMSFVRKSLLPFTGAIGFVGGFLVFSTLGWLFFAAAYMMIVSQLSRTVANDLLAELFARIIPAAIAGIGTGAAYSLVQGLTIGLRGPILRNWIKVGLVSGVVAASIAMAYIDFVIMVVMHSIGLEFYELLPISIRVLDVLIISLIIATPYSLIAYANLPLPKQEQTVKETAPSN